MPAQYPLINGLRYDYSSITLKLGSIPYGGVRSINYKHSVEPGELRGNRAQVVGTTRGQYKAEGSIEIYTAEHDDLLKQLSLGGRGFFEQFFEASVSYAETGQPTITDLLKGVRLKSGDYQNSEGSDGTFVRCDLLIMVLLPNGKSPLAVGQLLK